MASNQLNMKITYLRLVNHIVLGDVEFNLDNDIISILGKNGSGKSFLLDTLHPYGKSRRFIGSYPVKVGNTGLKQVNFTTPDGVVYETKHEYTPKGNTHSCKSYIIKKVNGTEYDLNPTGHCTAYEEIVGRILNFDPSCMDIGFLSFKSNGITSSKGSERKKILDKTIENSVLTAFKKNVRTMFTRCKYHVTDYTNKKNKIASKCTVESLTDDLHKLDREIGLYKKNLKSTHQKLTDLTQELSAIENVANFNLDKVRKVVGIYNLMDESNPKVTVYDKYRDSKEMFKTYSQLTEEIYKIETTINSLRDKKSLENRLEQLKQQLDKGRVAQADIHNRLSTYINTEVSTNDIMYWLDRMSSTARDFTDIIQSVDVVGLTGREAVMEIINELTLKKKDNDDFLARYRLNLDSMDGNKYEVQPVEACNTCSLYTKFVKSEEFVEKNKDRWDRLTTVEQAELEATLQKLYTLRDCIKRQLETLLGDAFRYLTSKAIVKFKLETPDSFIKGCNDSSLCLNLDKFRDWFTDMVSTSQAIQNKATDIINQIDRIEVEINSKNYGEIDNDIDTLQDIMENKRLAVREYDSKLSSPLYKELRSITDDDIDLINCMNMDKDAIVSLYNTMICAQENTTRLKKEIELTRAVVDEMPTKIEKLVTTRGKIDSDRKALIRLDDSLLEFSAKKTVLERCKDMIDKEIPIRLMRNHLDFIQKTTNKILASNDINMSIDISWFENEIIIGVTKGDVTIQDASQLSSGETCVVSLLMNACILHIIGYPILCMDELDSNLDSINRAKMNSIVCSIMSTLNIAQVICISHNITASISYATKIIIGDASGLDLHAYDMNSVINI